jgi:NADPH:quinone reductase-like Zn-dependent oxidoreductase
MSEANVGEQPETMMAIRLHAPGGPEQLVLESIPAPRLREGEVLVRVHAAAITRDELEWPTDRLPAIPSYEVSGVVVAVTPGVEYVAIGEPVYALTRFDRDGAATEYVALAATELAPKPDTLDHVESAAIPMAGLSAWQGLFDHGHLEAGQRVLIHGAAGGVGHVSVQLARVHGAYVIGTSSQRDADRVRAYGANEVLDADSHFESTLEPVDLVFDTAGGARLARSESVVRPGGRLVSIAEEPPEPPPESTITSSYFVVAPNRDQLVELARLADRGELRPAIDSVFPLADARAAFARSMASGKQGKVVLRIHD